MPGPFIHNIDPVIGQIGGMYLWWYGLSYTLGFLTLFRWTRGVRGFLDMDVKQVYDLCIFVAAGVLLGGRLVEVVFYEWAYYGAHPWHIFAVWIGGMSTHGILLGGTIGLWLFCRRYRKSFLAVADEMVIPAALIMGAGIFSGTLIAGFGSDLSLVIASSLGSFLVLLIVVVLASRIKDTMALLIIGLMFGSITAAMVSILSYFTEAEQLRQYVYWSFGSVGNLSWPQLALLTVVILIGIVLSILSMKALNALLLGENYARSIGIAIRKSRYLIIVATGLLAGSVTAFAGPIAFIGLAVPHLTKQIFNTTDHRILVPAVLIYGAILLLLCDTLAQLPSSAYVLPLNAITSIIGAPVVIWLLVRKKKMIF